MQHTLRIIFGTLVSLAAMVALSGCNLFPELRDSLRKTTTDTLDSVNKTVENVGYQLETTKRSVEGKIDEVETAVKEVNEAVKQVDEAVNAIKKVTGQGATPTTGTTGTTTKQETSPAKEAPNLK